MSSVHTDFIVSSHIEESPFPNSLVSILTIYMNTNIRSPSGAFIS